MFDFLKTNKPIFCGDKFIVSYNGPTLVGNLLGGQGFTSHGESWPDMTSFWIKKIQNECHCDVKLKINTC